MVSLADARLRRLGSVVWPHTKKCAIMAYCMGWLMYRQVIFYVIFTHSHKHRHIIINNNKLGDLV